MNLRRSVDAVLDAHVALTASEVRKMVQFLTGHTVRLNTMTEHLRTRTKMDAGADLVVVGEDERGKPRYAKRAQHDR